MVGRIWIGLDEGFRRRVLVSALEAHGEDVRSHLVDLAARHLRRRPITLMRATNERIVDEFFRGFTTLADRHQVGWIASRYRGAMLDDFNACIGIDGSTAPPTMQPREFEEAAFAAFAEKYGADELTLALAFAASAGRTDCRQAARRILEGRRAEARSQKRDATRSMQETDAPPEESASSREQACAVPPKTDGEGAAAPVGAPMGALSEAVGWPGPDESPNSPSGASPHDALPRASAAGSAIAAASSSEASPSAELVVAEATDAAEAMNAKDLAFEAEPWSHPKAAVEALDRLLIQAIVTTLLGQSGAAIQKRELPKLVEDFVALNVQRFQSYYLLGFLHGLCAQRRAELGIASNRPRVAWYTAGHLHGVVRSQGPAALLDGLDTLKEPELTALTDPQWPGPCQRMLASIVEAAIELGKPAAIYRWMKLSGPADERVTRRVLRWALESEQRNPREALELVATATEDLRGCLRNRGVSDPNGDPEVVQGMLSMLGHYREAGASDSSADCLVMASQLLQASRAEPGGGEHDIPPDLAAQIETAHVFACAELTFPKGLIPAKASAPGRLHARLSSALQDAGISDANPMRLCARLLGAIEQCLLGRPAHAASAGLVREAREASFSLRGRGLGRWGSVRTEDFAATIEMLGDLVVVLAGLDDSIEPAIDRIVEWMDEGGILAKEICAKALEHAAIAGCRNLGGLLRATVKLHGSAAVKLSDIQELARDPEPRKSLLALLTSPEAPIPIDERLDAIAALGRVAAAHLDRGVCDASLDHLRERGANNPSRFANRLVELLREPVWRRLYDESELNGVSIDMAFRSGHFEQAGLLVSEELQRALSDGNYTLAQDYIEMLDERRLGHLVADEQREWLRHELRDAVEAPRNTGRAPLAVRIYFIGGNEIQQRWDDEIRRRLQREAPGVSVDFLHTGWDSNWGAHVDEISRRIDGYAAVVLMKFVRTILGEKVRKLASERQKPWIPCTGHGLSSVQRSIVAAAAVARARRG